MQHFHLGKSGERDFLVDDKGKAFFSLGLVHTLAYLDGEAQSFFEERYDGDWAKLTTKILADLKSWGFNTAGYHSPTTMFGKIPFMLDSYLAPISYFMGRPTYPDVFDPSYRAGAEDALKQVCSVGRTYSDLIGYYWTDTPRWDLKKARDQWGTDWVSAIRSLPHTAPGKKRYAEYLCEATRNSDDINLYTGGVTPTTDALLYSDFAGLNLEHPTVITHDREFLRLIAHEYYSIAAEVSREIDPDHLLFGDRYISGDHPPEVLEEAVKHVDLISVQPNGITFDPDYFDNLHARTGKPIMICDHAISFRTEDYPETVWPQCPNEEEAARAYDAYLNSLIRRPYIIGYHRCQYIDRVLPGTSILKQGLLRIDETPYHTLLDQVSETNRKVLGDFPHKP